MEVATLFIQKRGQKDDIVHFFRSSEDPDRIRVVYRDGNTHRHRAFRFHIGTSFVSDYVSDILFGLRYDADPFEYVQVLTVIGPSVLYHVSELDDVDVRAHIRTTVAAACNIHVERTSLLSSVRD